MLATARDIGYRYLEGLAHRLLGECLAMEDPIRAAATLEIAAAALEAVGARNDLAKAWVAQAELQRAGGDAAAARGLLQRAASAFESLGTLDESTRVRAALASFADVTLA